MTRIFLLIPLLFFISCSTKLKEEIKINNVLSPANSESAEPFLFTDANNNVYLSWVEKRDKIHSFKYSTFDNDKWTEPKVIASDSTWFVNWADYPMIAANSSGSFLSHVLARSGKGTYFYDVKMFASNDGSDWNKTFLLNDDNKKAEHGFVSIIPYKDNFFVTWLDGRNTAMDDMEDMKDMNHSGHHGAMSLRAAIISTDGKRVSEWELDKKTCDCCQTTAAITDNGPVVIYRDRSDEEIRDISITRLLNNEWTTPKPVFQDNWKIAGCPVNGPRSYAIGNNLVIAWYSLLDSKAQVKVVFSSDGGATFNEPIRIDEGSPIGRVDALLLDKEVALVSWMEGSTIKAVKVKANGTKEDSFVIAASSDARTSGFPQMTKSENDIVFAWTDNEAKNVKVASLELSKLLP